MALNLFPELADAGAIVRNQRALARHLDDDHYVRGFGPGDFVLDTNAAFVQITSAAPQWPAIEFPDGVLSIATVSWRKPSEWRSGIQRLRWWYTSDVGDTNTFAILYRLRAIRADEVVPGTLLTADPVSLALPGPAVANTLLRTDSYYTTVAFDGDDELFSFQLFRTGGGDANNNDFHLVYLEVEHIRAVLESQ